MRRAIADSVADERARNPNPDRSCADRGSLLAAVQGGNIFALLVAAVSTLIFYEWTRIVKGWGAAWYLGGFVYALLPALALLWIRERDAHGLYLLIWAFIVTWSTDIGAYFAGRRFGKRKLAPPLAPTRRSKGWMAGLSRQASLAVRG